jgi:chromosome segregation ATPase
MRKVSELLSLSSFKQILRQWSILPAGEESKSLSGFSDLGARIGEDNESLRNLLLDTEDQFGAIHELEDTFRKLVQPLHGVFTTLEKEKANNSSLNGSLATLRSSHEQLHRDFLELSKKSSELESANQDLTQKMETALQKARDTEADRSRVSHELASTRATLAATTKQLADQINKADVFNQEKARLIQRADAADKTIVALEAEGVGAHGRIALLENDKSTLQAALDKTLGESSRISQQLAETESALAVARSNIQKLEGDVAAAEADRNKFSAECDEAKERRQSDIYALELKFDGLRSRAETAEKMLAGVREELAARTDEHRADEAKLFEASVAEGKAEKQIEHLSGLIADRDQQIAALEQEIVGWSEKYKTLSESVQTTEDSLALARRQTASLTEEVDKLQGAAAMFRLKAEEDFLQLSATVEHERSERAMAEAALERARRDYAKHQVQTAQRTPATRRRA